MTLAQAQAQLEAWEAASLALATGQAYTIGSRSLTRSDGSEVRKMIDFWQGRVDRLSGTCGISVRRGVPRDI